MQYHGGMVIRARSHRPEPKAYFVSSDPGRSRVRELADEARRVFRTRVSQVDTVHAAPRLQGCFEMAATVDYLFGYDATAM